MKGTVALLIPGNMCDARMWRGGGGVITRTLRKVLGVEPLDANVFKDDTIEAMASRALSSRARSLLPVGFSMGAIVAVEMALQSPDRVKGLILSGYNAGADLPNRASARPGQQEKARSGHLQELVTEELKPHYLAAENKFDGILRALLSDMAMAAGADVFVRQSEALRIRKSYEARLCELDVPVLFLAGHEDRLCPPEWHANWSSRTPGSDFFEIKGAGHMVPLEQPCLFAKAIENWIVNNMERLAA